MWSTIVRNAALPMLLWGTAACASNQRAAVEPTAAECADSSRASATPGQAPVALPRYFTLRVQTDHISVAGALVEPAQVTTVLSRAARDSANRGAVLMLDAGTSAALAAHWLQRVLDAGFSHVVLTRGTTADAVIAASNTGSMPEDRLPGAATVAPVAPSQAADRVAPPVAASIAIVPEQAQVTVPGPVDPTEPSAMPESAPRVEVKQMGLHIGGGPHSEEEVARYAGPISKRFAEFRACYPLARGTRKAASFGVDLLIGARGGRAKIKDFRTVLTGKDFLACMLDVFGGVEFSAPGKDTVVSYSLLFKPQPQ